MCADIAFESVSDPIPRDRWKRPLVIPPGGGKAIAYTRCTTFIDVLEDKYNLQLWFQRMVCVGLAKRPDLMLSASSLAADPEANKAKLNALCDTAREAASASAAATIGTALHALTEQMDRGVELGPVPIEYAQALAHYKEATADFQHVHIEQFLVNDQYKVGGTPDRISLVDGRLTVLDTKTGSTDYGHLKFAMQMAMYAHSSLYDPATGARTPLEGIDLERGIIVGLSAKTGEVNLLEVDLRAGWEAIETAAAVRQWRARKDIAKAYTPATPRTLPTRPATSPIAESLTAAIEAATSLDELTELWRAAGDEWADHHTAAASKRRAHLDAV